MQSIKFFVPRIIAFIRFILARRIIKRIILGVAVTDIKILISSAARDAARDIKGRRRGIVL